LRQVRLWTDEEIVKKEVKSCDNRELGSVKQVDPSILVAEKSGRRYQIPRESIATFDGDHVWLRATEAEVSTGVYPFLDEIPERLDTTVERMPLVPPAPPPNP
jgi:hypothetical protein